MPPESEAARITHGLQAARTARERPSYLLERAYADLPADVREAARIALLRERGTPIALDEIPPPRPRPREGEAWIDFDARRQAWKAWRAAHPAGPTAAQRRAQRMAGIPTESIDRAAVLARQGGCCYACKLPLDLSTATLDHIDPIAGEYAEHTMRNAGMLCASCNSSKGARPLTDEWLEAREAMAWDTRYEPDDDRPAPQPGPPPGLPF